MSKTEQFHKFIEKSKIVMEMLEDNKIKMGIYEEYEYVQAVELLAIAETTMVFTDIKQKDIDKYLQKRLGIHFSGLQKMVWDYQE